MPELVNFNQPQNRLLWIGFFLTTTLFAVFFMVIYPKNSVEFAYTTKCNFVKEIPGLEQILSFRASYRRFINEVEKSFVFKPHSNQISRGLQEFCDKLFNANQDLNTMYREGINFFKLLDEDIDSIISRFSENSSFREGDLKYFYEKVKNILGIFQDFKKLVGQTKFSIDSLENDRHVTEAHVFDGLRDAQNFIIKNDKGSNTAELSIVKNQIDSVDNILLNLHTTAIYLDKVKKILMAYDEYLLEVLDKFKNVGRDKKSGVFELSLQDAKYLKYSIGYLKSIHYKFTK